MYMTTSEIAIRINILLDDIDSALMQSQLFAEACFIIYWMPEAETVELHSIFQDSHLVSAAVNLLIILLLHLLIKINFKNYIK